MLPIWLSAQPFTDIIPTPRSLDYEKVGLFVQAARVAAELQEEAATQLAEESCKGGAGTTAADSAKPDGNAASGRGSGDLMEVDELVMLPVCTFHVLVWIE